MELVQRVVRAYERLSMGYSRRLDGALRFGVLDRFSQFSACLLAQTVSFTNTKEHKLNLLRLASIYTSGCLFRRH